MKGFRGIYSSSWFILHGDSMYDSGKTGMILGAMAQSP